MISYIRGTLVSVEKEKAVLDVNGIGFGIFMPEKSLGALPALGTEVKLHTWLNVREDAMQLFGFLTRDDLEMFRMAISVSGIGPKGGLGILSCLSADELRFAVLSGDAKAISAAPGIGKKTAEKLILELRDKLKLEEVLDNTLDSRNSGDPSAVRSVETAPAVSEAVQALVALGYGSTESMQAVNKVKDGLTSTEEILKAALKHLF